MKINTTDGDIENKLNNYKRQLDIKEKYSDKLVLSLIEPHSNNPHINKETKFPIVADLTALVQSHNRDDEEHISRNATGWKYSERVTICNNDVLNINNENYTIEASTIRNINTREMIVRNNETQELGIIDVKNLENQEEIYKLIKEQKFSNTNKKAPKKNKPS